MSLLILAVDDEPDVETLFRQQFRRDLRAGRFTGFVALRSEIDMRAKRAACQRRTDFPVRIRRLAAAQFGTINSPCP